MAQHQQKQQTLDDDAAFLATLREEFLTGASGELDAWEENLLNFERTGESAAIGDLKRLVHSMKGSAQAIGLTEAGECLHLLEAWLMDNMNTKSRTEVVSHCLQATDAFRAYYEALGEGEDGVEQGARLRTLLG